MQRQSRLQRLQQRHREIGRILRDAIGDDIDDVGMELTTNEDVFEQPRIETVDDVATGDAYEEEGVQPPASDNSIAQTDSLNASHRSALASSSMSQPTSAPLGPPPTLGAVSATHHIRRLGPNSPFHGMQTEEQQLERQLGRTLPPSTKASTDNLVHHSAPRPPRQKYDIPADGLTPSLPAANNRGAAAAQDGSNTAATHGGSAAITRHASPLCSEEQLRTSPYVLRLEAQTSQLQAALQEKDDQVASLQKKTEALARNLVKALKERNQFEEELLQSQAKSPPIVAGGATSTTSTSDVYSRAWGGSGSRNHAEEYVLLADELKQRNSELEASYRELDRLVGLGLRSKLLGHDHASSTHGVSHRAGDLFLADNRVSKDNEIIHLKREVEMYTSSLRSVESQRDRLAAELRLSAACIENLDQRLLLSERELLQARLTLAAKQPLEAGEPKSGVADGLDLVSLPLAARMHMARLTAEVSALHNQLTQMLQDEQRRAAFDRDVQAELKHHNASLEGQLTDMMSKLSAEAELHETTRRGLSQLEAIASEICAHANLVANTIQTSKHDVDRIIESVTAGGLECSRLVDVIRPFAHQAGRDLLAVSQLLSAIRGALAPVVQPARSQDRYDTLRSDADETTTRRGRSPHNGTGEELKPSTLLPKRRLIPAPSVERQLSVDSATTLKSTGLGWQRSGGNLRTSAAQRASQDRSPSPAYPQ